VGTWDGHAARAAMIANGWSPHRGGSVVRAALTMADYLIPGLSGTTSLDGLDDEDRDSLYRLVAQRSSDIGGLIGLVGTGPASVIRLQDSSKIYDAKKDRF
jgi:hypothetical protein